MNQDLALWVRTNNKYQPVNSLHSSARTIHTFTYKQQLKEEKMIFKDLTSEILRIVNKLERGHDMTAV